MSLGKNYSKCRTAKAKRSGIDLGKKLEIAMIRYVGSDFIGGALRSPIAVELMLFLAAGGLIGNEDILLAGSVDPFCQRG